MTREKAIEILKDELYSGSAGCDAEISQALDMAIKALEQEPYEKFESTKDHIYKLAGDYKCWDNRLTQDEALELCHILEQEPCEDAIDRQAVIDEIEFYQINPQHFDFVSLIGDIKGLPSVTPTQKWIPVSERLPDDRDWYFGIFRESDTGWINPLPFVCDYVGHETKATTKEHWILRGFTDRDEHIDYYFNLECVAWMPLPEPYKTEGEVEE